MPNYSKEPFNGDPKLQRLIGFDTETSGLDPEKNGILSMAAIAHDRQGNELDRFHTYVNPGDVEYHPQAMAKNNIQPEQIASAPSPRDALAQLTDFYKRNGVWQEYTDNQGNVKRAPKHTTVTHNGKFDDKMIEKAFDTHFPEGKEEFQNAKGHLGFDTFNHLPDGHGIHTTLDKMGKAHDVPNRAPHTALGDVEQTLGIAHSIMGGQRRLERLEREASAPAPTPIKPKTPSIMDMMRDESSGPRPKVAGIKWMT